MFKTFACCAAIALSALLATAGVAQPVASKSERGNLHAVPLGHSPTRGAEREARRTLPVFIAKWRAKPAGYAAFRLKAGFRTDDGRGEEFLWLEPLSIAPDGMITGRLSNDSAAIARLKDGVEAQVPTAKVADWMYVKNGKMYGHDTTRAQLDLASPEQRARLVSMLSPQPLEPGDH